MQSYINYYILNESAAQVELKNYHTYEMIDRYTPPSFSLQYCSSVYQTRPGPPFSQTTSSSSSYFLSLFRSMLAGSSCNASCRSHSSQPSSSSSCCRKHCNLSPVNLPQSKLVNCHELKVLNHNIRL